MKLKNITPFESFKRIYESTIPSEFSNNTGFKESLVGRAVFGILRYFKKGIQLGQLEYYKRKLENEYFAAILRFCATKEIDLKNPVAPVDDENPPGNNSTNPPVPDELIFCEILSEDYISSSNQNTYELPIIKISNTQALNHLNSVLPFLIVQSQIDDCQAVIKSAQDTISCCDKKMAINVVFITLSGATDNATISTCLDQIKAFFESPEAKFCSTYKGTDNEKNLVKSFTTHTDPGVKGKADAIVPLFDNFRYRNYDLVQEKITSGINKSVNIEQMLGDQLRGADAPSKNINIYEYLKKIGLNSVDEINFVELVKIFRDHPEFQESVSSEKYLNIASIRKIQYAVADGIIFHVKKTPDNVGINPGTGGGASMGGSNQYDEDTSMRKVWEKKVEFVKSEFAGFFNFRTVDPFVLLNLSDAMRKRGEYKDDPVVSGDRGNTETLAYTSSMETYADKMGLIAQHDRVIDTPRKPFVIVLKNNYTNDVSFAVFSLHKNSTRSKIYRYIGVINFSKILSTKDYDKADFNTLASKYSNAVWDTVIKPDTDSTFLNFLRLPGTLNGGSSDFDSIYISTTDFNALSSSKEPKPHNLRFLFNFVKRNTGTNNSKGRFKGIKDTGTSADFDLRCLKNGNNTLESVTIANVKTSTADKLISFKVGEFFQIKDSWLVNYFPDSRGLKASEYVEDINPIPIDKEPYIRGGMILNP